MLTANVRHQHQTQVNEIGLWALMQQQELTQSTSSFTGFDKAFNDAYACFCCQYQWEEGSVVSITRKWMDTVLLPVFERTLKKARKSPQLQLLVNKVLMKCISFAAMSGTNGNNIESSDAEKNLENDGILYRDVHRLSIALVKASQQRALHSGVRIAKSITRLLISWLVDVLLLCDQSKEFPKRYRRLRILIEWVLFNLLGYSKPMCNFFVEFCVSQAIHLCTTQDQFDSRANETSCFFSRLTAEKYRCVLEGLFLHFKELVNRTTKEQACNRLERVGKRLCDLLSVQSKSGETACVHPFCFVSKDHIFQRYSQQLQESMVSNNVFAAAEPLNAAPDMDHHECGVLRFMSSIWKMYRTPCGTSSESLKVKKRTRLENKSTPSFANLKKLKRLTTKVTNGGKNSRKISPIFRMSSDTWNIVLQFLARVDALNLRGTCSSIKDTTDQCFQWYCWYMKKWGNKVYLTESTAAFSNFFQPFCVRSRGENLLEQKRETQSRSRCYAGKYRKKTTGKMCPVYGCSLIFDDESSLSQHTKESHGLRYRTIIQYIKCRERSRKQKRTCDRV